MNAPSACIANEVRDASAQSLTLSASGFLFSMCLTKHLKLAKLAVANSRTLDRQAGLMLTA